MKGLLLSLALFFLSISGINAQNRCIRFLDDDWTVLLERAKKSRKLIFVDCYTSWCGPCKTLAKDIFTLDSVADFFNQHFPLCPV